MSGPMMDRANSRQDYETPPEFIAAVEYKFGPLVLDLACTRQNCKAQEGIYYPEGDSLQVPWTVISTVHAGGLCWLNPPFANIRPWALKCAAEKEQGASTLLLVPLGDQNWYWDYVQPYADVYWVGRMKFVGASDPYPKDLILAHYWEGSPLVRGRPVRWRWQGEQQVR